MALVERASRRDIIEASKKILAGYSYPVTMRQLYYRLVSRLVIANHQKEYKRVVGAMTAARKSGEIRPDTFADPTRRILAGHGYLTLEQYLETFRYGYERDPWQDQENEVWVMVEKEALASVFEGPCNELSVPLMICRGYPSITALYTAARTLRHYQRKRELHILYFGDHDPSGKDIDRNIASEIDFWARSSGIGRSLTRIALTTPQIDEYDLPPMPEKVGDSRTRAFQEEHGVGMSVELDALDPHILERMVMEEIEKHIDQDVWEESKEKNEEDIRKLHALIDSVGDGNGTD